MAHTDVSRESENIYCIYCIWIDVLAREKTLRIGTTLEICIFHQGRMEGQYEAIVLMYCMIETRVPALGEYVWGLRKLTRCESAMPEDVFGVAAWG